MPQPLIFISYSHRDGVWKDRLLSHLRPLEKSGVLGVWHDGMLTAGSDWLAEIRGALSAAKVAILLVTADFLGSDFIQRAEVAEILARRQREGLHVIPVIVKSCLWQNIDWLSSMQVRPPQGKPLAEHRGNQRDTQLTAIAAEVNRYLTTDPEGPRSKGPVPTYDPAPEHSPPVARAHNDVPIVPATQAGPAPQPKRKSKELAFLAGFGLLVALLSYQLAKPGAVEPPPTDTHTTRKEELPKPAAGHVRLWPGSTVPFVIEVDFPNMSRVTDAISLYEERTNLRFVMRTRESDYVRFRAGNGCSSGIGVMGGAQDVTLGAACTTGEVLHVLGHVIGLNHEESRPDRDNYVTIDYTKVQPAARHNFDIHNDALNVRRRYDYGSIMHQPKNAFSIDGSPTIEPIDPTATIGQRTTLSKSDVDLINSLYPTIGKSQ